MLTKNILLIDDQPDILELLTDYLEASGYTIFQANNTTEAWAHIEREQLDVIVLDVMMPGEDGFSFCKAFRKHRTTPILFLSAKESEQDRIRGLTIGGDDYIVKSVSPAEVVARVNAMYRRQQLNQVNNKQRNIHVHNGSLELTIKDERINLSLYEYRLFHYLYENRGIILSYDQILYKVWKDELQDPQIVRVYIAKLREKLRTYDDILSIRTIRSLGYQLIEVDYDEP
ncbi:response regulator receiver [Geomicrobium sp. JCM 19037]|uniref:response regulator transcription factor n=1 Tax=Geomicrobium sp. JCM 19037 TaxID=1460634 RepID=UPI00045F38D2|nr:response regulator transcription factor [Geomicrobium sp. JCM 19037]GAK05549.1 response regulator receiver [Geomicrobium sp. JCM 19037]